MWTPGCVIPRSRNLGPIFLATPVSVTHDLPETVLYGIPPRRRLLAAVVHPLRAVEGLGQLERVLERIAHAGPRGEERARHQNDAVKKT